MSSKKTTGDKLRAKFIKQFEALLDAYEQDIKSGLEDGTYDKADNIKTQLFIEDCKETLEKMIEDETVVYVYVEGGNIQGASATHSVSLSVYDKDCYKDDPDYVENNGTPEEWDKMIKNLEKENTIKGIY